jgi:Uma2 family endonuclease
MIASLKYTHSDLQAMPDDGKRREIIDGEIYVSPSPVDIHQCLLLNLSYEFCQYLKARPIGIVRFAPLDVILSDYEVLQPDLLFVLNEHRGRLQDWMRGAPDLVVEIISPNTEARDRGPKMKTYARHGIGEYWIVDPDSQTIEVHRLSSQGYQSAEKCAKDDVLATPLLPGFALPVGSIFLR